MPSVRLPNGADDKSNTIRILVATDNHVGYNERDAVRGDDSWKSFHEILCLAKERDVDMVLLGGDLFHENVPSRKSMYQVMRSLRLNCYGDKPCEVEILSDGSEHFDTSIGHANYEDENINVAIPVFSIHGNHDDPSGDGHYAALDLLEMSGLINYFGRTPENDNIHVKPLLLQKGMTKIALYGLSNVRDERMYRSFRDHQVHFYEPNMQRADWYNIAVVHQNHHAHSQTSYLPENFLPSFLDLVIWGHEHECDIEPHLNPEMNFRVMQPGSSVATSLVPGEAVPKCVSILTVTGREMKSEPIRLKTVRPFVYKDIVLSSEKAAIKIAQDDNHRHKLTTWLTTLVDEMIIQARTQWEEGLAENNEDPSDHEFPLPLIRLRVETSNYNAIKFETENPQRFSNRFTGRVANNHDVVQFHQKKRTAAARRAAADAELKELMNREVAENVKVSSIVADFLAAQSLTILPQNYFGDAVNQYIDKDDKHAMDMFVNESLSKQVRHLVSMHEADHDAQEDESLAEQIEQFRAEMEEMFKKGQLKNRAGGKARYKPKPDGWDTDLDGEWEDQAAAVIRDETAVSEEDDGAEEVSRSATRGRGRARASRAVSTTNGRRGRGAARSRAATATARNNTKAPTRGKRPQVVESEEDEDVDMHDNDDDDDEEDAFEVDDDDNSQAMFYSNTNPKTSNKSNGSSIRGSRAGSVTSTSNSRATGGRKPIATAKPPAPPTRKTPARTAVANAKKQASLNFSASQASVLGTTKQQVEEISDDDEAFESIETTTRSNGKRKR